VKPGLASTSSSSDDNMLHTLSQIPNYLNHYTQLNAQLTAFQQHYAQTSYILTTGLGHHHGRGEDNWWHPYFFVVFVHQKTETIFIV